MIPYGRQSIDQDDIDAVVEVMRGDRLTTGPGVADFERALADYCGARHAIAVANGTAALHVAALAAGIRHGDGVLTSAVTFLASANCAEMVGANAYFADVDADTVCVTRDTVKAAWRNGTKAIIPVDFAGFPCVSEALADFAHDCGALVIEDASHAIGSSRDGHSIGGLPWVDMTTFSFHPVKNITCGEGGAIVTNRDDLAERCRLFRNHGMAKPDPVKAGYRDTGPWFYEMNEVGYNYRITDMQCALGLSQLKKLDQFISRRREITAQYNNAFRDVPHLAVPVSDRLAGSGLQRGDVAWHLYVLRLDFDAIGKTRMQVMSELHAQGIGTQVHYIPVHLQPYYKGKRGNAACPLPVSEAYYARCLSLPLFPAMTDDDSEKVIAAVLEVVGAT